jgi:hypothetical protein
MARHANSASHRYGTPPAITNGHRVSHTETPFCELDAHGHCRNQFHTHTAPARRSTRWTPRRKV